MNEITDHAAARARAEATRDCPLGYPVGAGWLVAKGHAADVLSLLDRIDQLEQALIGATAWKNLAALKTGEALKNEIRGR